MESIVLLLFSFFALILLRVNIGFALFLSSAIVMTYEDLSLVSAMNQMYSGIESFPLMAVLFFMFLGRLLNRGGITDRLLKVADTTVGHIRGGLGQVNVVVSMVFASLSGSAAADTASIGAILIPAMKKAGYDPAFSAALTAASSTLGVIIPPSIILIIYGAFGDVSIGALFLGGVVPGIMIGLLMMAYTFIMALKHGYPSNPRAGVTEMFKAVKKGLLPLFIPVIVMGGIIGGFFTPTEAAIFAVVWALLLSFCVYREVSIKKLPAILSQAVIDFSVAMFAVAGAKSFGFLISYLGAADAVVAFILSVTGNPIGIMLLLICFLLLIGTVLNPIAVVLIFLPIIQSLGDTAGINPVHLGVLATISLSVGLISPPYGICLLIASQIAEISVSRSFFAIMPIVVLVISIAVASLFVPEIITGLPKLFMPSVFGAG